MPKGRPSGTFLAARFPTPAPSLARSRFRVCRCLRNLLPYGESIWILSTTTERPKHEGPNCPSNPGNLARALDGKTAQNTANLGSFEKSAHRAIFRLHSYPTVAAPQPTQRSMTRPQPWKVPNHIHSATYHNVVSFQGKFRARSAVVPLPIQDRARGKTAYKPRQQAPTDRPATTPARTLSSDTLGPFSLQQRALWSTPLRHTPTRPPTRHTVTQCSVVSQLQFSCQTPRQSSNICANQRPFTARSRYAFCYGASIFGILNARNGGGGIFGAGKWVYGGF